MSQQILSYSLSEHMKSTFSHVPTRFEKLPLMTLNVWWAWNQEMDALWLSLAQKKWEAGECPSQIVQNTSEEEWKSLSTQESFCDLYDRLAKKFTDNFPKDFYEHSPHPVAYFSFEYGLHETLPFYCGGLGILSGDHVKSASDLQIPLIGVGLFYHDGYFLQKFNSEGKQLALPQSNKPQDLPLIPLLDPEKKGPLTIQIPLFDDHIVLQAYYLQVGNTPLFLLDTKNAHNNEYQQNLLDKLYGGDQKTRLSQEIIIGIGGVRLLQKLNITPSFWHLNEGHCAFLQLERLKSLQEKNSYEECREEIKKNSLFTTHTPVKAGNETFSYDLISAGFANYFKELQNSNNICQKAIEEAITTKEKIFDLTAFALKHTGFSNGVSKLHGHVARNMWKHLWPEKKNISDIPITHITNGVHPGTWIHPQMKKLIQNSISGFNEKHYLEKSSWKTLNHISSDDFVTTKQQMKKDLYAELSSRVALPMRKFIPSYETFEKALVVGFARRFATYKRANLIFAQKEKLQKILGQKDRPVIFLFAGKAHPQDIEGQNLIAEIYQHSLSADFSGKIFLLENYDMSLGKSLVSGVDLWLNNPIPPMEASGTSGQKVSLNGTPNLSVLDGWWYEGFNPSWGWSFGEQKIELDENQINLPNPTPESTQKESESFYNIFENEVIPLYFDMPDMWLQKCKMNLIHLIPQFNSHRMLHEYGKLFYSQSNEYKWDHRNITFNRHIS